MRPLFPLVPFTLPAHGSNNALLLCFTVLYKSFNVRIGGHCFSAFEPAWEVVIAWNRCVKSELAHWDRGVTF